jgi:hypothetical protein
MDDNSNNLDFDSLTLEQAKQELLHLQSFKNATFNFLHALCGYEIREHAQSLLIRHRIREFQNIEPSLDPREFMERAEFVGEDIFRVADIVARLTQGERFPRTSQDYVLQKTSLDQILNSCVVQAQEKIEYDNRNRAALRNNKQVVLMQAPNPIEFATEIPSNLPSVNANESLIKRVLIDLTWFITRHHLKTKVEFKADFDNHLVSIAIGCWSFHTHDFSLPEYQQFESNPNFLTFSIPSLCLFSCWKSMKICAGQMKFDIEKSNTSGEKPDKTFVTIELPRYYEQS